MLWLLLLLLGVAALGVLAVYTALRPDARTAAVVVVGDVGRSPRMCYHATSLVRRGWRVLLIGYFDTALPASLCVDAVQTVQLPHVPVRLSKARALFVITALVKVPLLAYALFHAVVAAAPVVVFVQTPPAIPALGVLRLACALRKSALVIDWHNLGYTLLGMRLGQRHPLVRIAAWLERVSGRHAQAHLFVTRAMRNALLRDWGLHGEACVLHDRPSSAFRRSSPQERAQFLQRISPTIWPGVTCPVEGNDRAALVVTSTSWTPDEDIGMLIDAAGLYEKRAREDASLPRLQIVITGKGPLKAWFESQMHARAACECWQHVAMHTAWLATGDYPQFLSAADLGVSLHTSSSGLDLPMKVVDMLGWYSPG
ncbi:Alg1p [Malassezia vespertilionis]|uniref:Chitobiosyldiphosphodolichol beta-mannosyltransferase n=1 Tax=Malassezia vespertilionis TaxID=2020962 RepID=A0A2N1JDJ4_9BASI|nr:Alg1p [Malassezia vespertilionis]